MELAVAKVLTRADSAASAGNEDTIADAPMGGFSTVVVFLPRIEIGTIKEDYRIGRGFAGFRVDNGRDGAIGIVYRPGMSVIGQFAENASEGGQGDECKVAKMEFHKRVSVERFTF